MEGTRLFIDGGSDSNASHGGIGTSVVDPERPGDAVDP